VGGARQPAPLGAALKNGPWSNTGVLEALKRTAPPAATSKGRRSTCSPTCSGFPPTGHAAGALSPQTRPRCPGKQMQESVPGGWICPRMEPAAPSDFPLEGDLTPAPPRKLLFFQPSEVCLAEQRQFFPPSGGSRGGTPAPLFPCSPRGVGTHLELPQTLPIQPARHVPDAPGQADVERRVLKTKQGPECQG